MASVNGNVLSVTRGVSRDKCNVMSNITHATYSNLNALSGEHRPLEIKNSCNLDTKSDGGDDDAAVCTAAKWLS